MLNSPFAGGFARQVDRPRRAIEVIYMDNIACFADDQQEFRQEFIERFHPKKYRSRFYIATKFKQFANNDIDYAMTPPALYWKATLWRYGDYTHFTINCFRHKTYTHAMENLAVVLGIPMDFDGDYIECSKEINIKCEEIGMRPPAYKIRTRKGLHAILLLLFPATDFLQFNIIAELKHKLVKIFGGDPCQPGLNMLVAIPQTPLHLLYAEPANRIDNVVDLLRLIKDKKVKDSAISKQIRKIRKSSGAFQDGWMNSSLYTVMLIAKKYGIDRDQAIEDIENYFLISVSEIDGHSETIASAYNGNRHPKNYFVRACCLGYSEADFAYKIGWLKVRPVYKTYKRTMSNEEYNEMRTNLIIRASKIRGENTFSAIQKAASEIKASGGIVSAKRISAMTGITMRAIAKYRSFLE